MKVRVVLTLEIDADQYRAEYGTDDSAAEIREHVKSAIATAADQPGIIAPEGVVLSVEVK